MTQDDKLSNDSARPPAANDGNVTTGVTGLDEILGGGLVEDGLYLIEGMWPARARRFSRRRSVFIA